jgi:sterol desaturase/sphingolipid hydroxylase (fatty acid hydroxylase superfamily)
VFPWWDRVFGTYVDQPSGGQDRITFGLREFNDQKHLSVHWMLAQPFLDAERAHDSETPVDLSQPS